MTRVIVHAGFHKTATSSLQEFLGQNRQAFRPYFDLYLSHDFPKVATTSRIYGQRSFPWRRLHFRRKFREYLARVPDTDTIVMSRETFAGVMPGHRDVFRRMVQNQTKTAISLGTIIISELKKRFGTNTDIQFVYTTRAQAPWIRSVYGHLLRSIHLRDDFETFSQRFSPLPDPEKDAQTVASALAPVPVFIVRLEDFANHPHGTGAAIMDLVDIPDAARANLHPFCHENQGQSAGMEQKFLEINQSGYPNSELKGLKDAITETGNPP